MPADTQTITRLAREGIEEIGALRLEVVVRDVGLRSYTGLAQDVLDMLLGLTMGVKDEKPNDCTSAWKRPEVDATAGAKTERVFLA